MITDAGKTERVETERVRALIATTPPGPWTHEREGYGLHEVTMDRRRGVHVEGEAEAALIAAAPDLAADLLDARDECEAQRRELAELRARDVLFTRERIAVATVLDVPFASDLGAVVAQRLGELPRLRAEARRSDDECRRATLAAQVARSARGQAEGELARLRAVVAGRDVAPTDAELDAHRAAGGGWLLAWYGAAGMATEVVFDRRTAAEALEEAASLDGLFLALPLGSDRRPAAWPVPAAGGAPR